MFNFDEDFIQRWLNTPTLVRQVLKNDLMRLEQLLDKDTDFEQWKTQELKAKVQSNQMIEQTYLDVKQNLKLNQKNLLQLVLEKKLAQKRADEQAYQQKLQHEELQQNIQQIQTLQHIGSQVQQESQNYANRYQQNTPLFNFDVNDSETAKNLRLRLELESDELIRKAVQHYRQQLQAIATEEIEFILKQNEAKLSSSQHDESDLNTNDQPS